MVENPIQNVIGGGSSGVRIPNERRLRNTALGGAADAINSAATGVAGAVQSIKDEFTLADAQSEVDAYLTDHDQGVLNAAQMDAKRISASPGGVAAGSLRMSAAMSTMVASNPHLKDKLTAIYAPVEAARKYQIGTAINKGTSDAWEAQVEGATQWAFENGKGHLVLNDQLVEYGAHQVEQAKKQAVLDQLSFNAEVHAGQTLSQETFIAEQSGLAFSAVDNMSNEFKNMFQLSVSESKKMLSQKHPTAFAAIGDMDDEAYRDKLTGIYMSSLIEARDGFASGLAQSGRIVDMSKAQTDIAAYEAHVNNMIEFAKGTEFVDYMTKKNKLFELNVVSKLYADEPDLAKQVIIADQMANFISKLPGGTVLGNTIGNQVIDYLDTKQAPPPPPPPGAEGPAASDIATSGALETFKDPKSTKEELQSATSMLQTGIERTLDKPADTSLDTYKNILDTLGNDTALKGVMSEVNGGVGVTDFVTKFVDNKIAGPFSSILSTESNKYSTQNTGRSTHSIIESTKVGYEMVEYSVSDAGVLTFKPASNLTWQGHINTAEAMVEKLNKSTEYLNKAITVGAKAGGVNVKEYAVGVAERILGIPPSVTPEPVPAPRPADGDTINIPFDQSLGGIY